MNERNEVLFVVTGSRDGHPDVEAALDEFAAGIRAVSPNTMFSVASGGARGVDAQAQAWARRNKCIRIKYGADWKRWGRAAGPKRNAVMIKCSKAVEEKGVPVFVLAFPVGESRGTYDCIERALKARFDVRVWSGTRFLPVERTESGEMKP